MPSHDLNGNRDSLAASSRTSSPPVGFRIFVYLTDILYDLLSGKDLYHHSSLFAHGTVIDICLKEVSERFPRGVRAKLLDGLDPIVTGTHSKIATGFLDPLSVGLPVP